MGGCGEGGQAGGGGGRSAGRRQVQRLHALVRGGELGDEILVCAVCAPCAVACAVVRFVDGVLVVNLRFAQSAPAWPRQAGVAAPSGRGRQRAGAARHLTDSSSASLHLCAACGKLDYSAWGVRLPMQFCAGERVHMASKPTAISMRVVWLHKKSTRLRWFAICRACRCEYSSCVVLCCAAVCCAVLCCAFAVLCCAAVMS